MADERRARIVIEGEDKTGSAFRSVAGGLKGLQGRADSLGSAFAGAQATIATALGGFGLGAFIKNAQDGLLAMKDLKEATGASIAGVSGLENVMRAAGGSIDDVRGVLIKFNAALKEADGKNGVSLALQAIGLQADALRKLDPAEALRKTAVALAQFADDGEKARLVQELFGRSVAKAGPFLHELAEAGELNASVTEAQVEQADRLNKEMAKLSGTAQDAARAIGGGLAGAVNQLIDAIKGNGVGTLNQFLAVPLQAVSVVAANVAFVLRGIGVEVGGLMAQAAAVARLDFSGAATIGQAMKEDAKAAREELDKLERRLLQIGGAPQADYSNEGHGRERRLPGVKLPSKKDLGAAAKALKEAEANAAAMVAVEEMAARDAAEAWKFYDESQLRQHKESTEAWAKQWQQVFDEIDAEQDRAIEEGQAFLKKGVQESSEFAKEAARNVQDFMSDAIYNGFTGRFSDIGKDFGQLVLRMASQAAAANLSKYLFGDVAKTGNFSGGAIGDFFKWAGSSMGGADGTHATGLEYVPFDGYRAVLHRGERVQTAAQANAERRGATYQVIVQGDASENTISLLNGALAQFEARQMNRGY